MRESGFGVWRQALLGSLGVVSACAGQATDADETSNMPSTASGSGGDTGSSGPSAGGSGGTTAGGTGPDTTGSGGNGVTSHATTTQGTTGGGGSPTTTVTHRVEPAECDPFMASTESAIPPEYRGDGGAAGETGYPVFDFQCEFDSECSAGNNGDCFFYHIQLDGIYAGTRCSYGCNVDADCAAGTVCECTGGNNTCVPATCTTDDDCEGNRLCMRSEYFDGCSTNVHYACQSPKDECTQHADCPLNGECGFDPNVGHHKCMDASCVIGRPFLVYGSERRAETSRRSDWCSEPLVELAHLTPTERRVLATRWETIGSMEHASIAAFARFALQLLSVGAPADLLERTHAALADETRHAKLAYGLGRRYGGYDMGPAPLAMDGALDDHDLRSMVVNTVLEGCIGETVAAAEAAWGSEQAQDPVLRGALSEIAADEARHAELAFAFVHWAVQSDPRLAQVVLRTVRQALAALEPATSSGADAWLARHGLLPEERRSELKREALEEMVLPCLTAICAVGRAA